MITFFKKIIDSYVFSLKLKRLKKINSSFILVKIFFIRVFFSYPLIRNFIKSKKGQNILSDNFFEKKTSSNNILKNLEKDGYDSNKLTSNITEKIINEVPGLVASISLKERKKNKIDTSNFYCKDLIDFKNFTLKNKISHIKINLDLDKDSTLKDLISSNFATDIAYNYLNSNSVTLNAVIFISNSLSDGISDSELSDNAQKFHTDINFSKFYKIFIYLNDVNSQNGPHIFIPGTHKKKNSEHLNIERLNDNEIFNSYDEKVKFVGKKGTIFFEDTFGFHKGEEPKESSRITLVVEYGKNKIKYEKNSIFINFKK